MGRLRRVDIVLLLVVLLVVLFVASCGTSGLTPNPTLPISPTASPVTSPTR